MTQIVTTCPFCHAQNMTMDIIGVMQTKGKDFKERKLGQDIHGAVIGYYLYTHTAAGAALCRKCNNPVSLAFSWKNRAENDTETLSNLNQIDSPATADSLNVSYRLALLAPQNAKLAHLPEEVAKAYSQALKNMNMEGCEDAAAMMFRRSLETAIATQYPNISGRNLKEKINNLESQHIIPAAMKDWAHEIRAVGNDGAHELMGVSRDDAEAAQAFTAAFLQYCISLPAEIAQRRAPAQNQAQSGARA